LKAALTQSEQQLAQITSNYRQQLQKERAATYSEYQQLEQQWAKQQHRNTLLLLKAPLEGIVKDLATHTPGTVVSPGTVLATLVPVNEPLQAEVWLSNQDAGFVHPEQEVKLKLASFPFQRYGMVSGRITHVSADATEKSGNAGGDSEKSQTPGQLFFRALVTLETQILDAGGERYVLSPGMQVAAEIKLGRRTVMEYLLSPVQEAFHEAGRER
ncbi:MAG: HlyD family efflux transporter periplasmic adaptor subunit, partial [Burkholderiales bacterium]